MRRRELIAFFLVLRRRHGRSRRARSRRALPKSACSGLEPVRLFRPVWNRFGRDFAGQVMSRVRMLRSNSATPRQGKNNWPVTQPIWYARTSMSLLHSAMVGPR